MSTHSSIDRDVFHHQLAGVAEEMSEALRRSAHSSIIWDVYDYACALFTPGADMLAQAETIPAQLGTMGTALRHMLRAIPLDRWQEGDAFVCNDPYRGCTHTPDITVFTPVFHAGEIIAVTSTIAHHVDIGGRVPLTTSVDNAEVFGEGLIFPPVRLMRAGEPNQDVFDFIAANVRNPRDCIGDLRAQIAGSRTAERRLRDMAARSGNAAFRELSAEVLDYGEAYMRDAIRSLPDGVYEAEVLMEDGVASDELLRVQVAVTIEGDRIGVDFTGSSGQRACALNCPWSSTVSMTTYALKCLLAPNMLNNDGFNRPVALTAPLGAIVNPRRPAAVGSRHSIQQKVADVILRALAPLVPERSAAGASTAFPVFRAAGFDTRQPAEEGAEPKRYMIMSIMGGGMGGCAAADGLDAVDTHGGNCALLSAEVMEEIAPIRVNATRLVSGSGGEGKHRGGLAIERDFEVLAETAMVACSMGQAAPETAPWGMAGGSHGGPAAMRINPGTNRETIPPYRMRLTPLVKGDVLRVRSSGGGGHGAPGEREADDRARDAAEGYA